MGNLFDLIEPAAQGPTVNDVWRPEAPPSLDGVDTIYFNFETTGLRWFDIDLPLALAVRAKGRNWYLPFKHRGLGNLDEGQVYRFCQNEFKGKRLINTNTRFDIHSGRVWGDKMGGGGLDFEAMGCTFSDVSHSVALLDDHRFFMNLDSFIEDLLREKPMVRLDESRMASYSAGSAAPRAMYNVEIVERLEKLLNPRLEAEGLTKVKKLEDEVIPVVVEMEKNGTLIDMEKLDLWIKETERKYHTSLMDIYKATGLRVNPNSSQDIAKLYKHLKLPIVEWTSGGKSGNKQASFPDEVLKAEQHPHIKLVRHSKKLSSINSKLKKYQKCIGSDGILRYALHQLRAAKSDGEDGGETGTVVGRFTSTEIVRGVGINIQQVLKPEKQLLTFGDEYFIRDLHIPEKGKLHLSVDAEQLQYRIFAHEANSPKVLAAYAKDPWLSFHKMTLGLLRAHKPDLSYKRNKDTNFAKMFAAGPSKLGLMLEFITKTQYAELKAQKANRYHPWLTQVLEILKIYDKELPEVKAQNDKATALAKDRGYIKSIMGRRMRFPDGERLHKALNGRIIMSEADIVKTKAVELHKNRKYTEFLLRFQVHDEFDGDVPSEEHGKKVGEILNAQSFNLRVPILWKVNTGTSWGDCAADELKKIREEMHL